MAFKSFANIGRSIEDEGKLHYAYVTKLTTPSATIANYFVDLNQTSGTPKYNAFAGSQFAFTPLIGEGNNGVYVGPFIAGSTKHLLRWQVLNPNTTVSTTPPDHIYLSDYLGFYPLIDCDDTDPQVLDNTQSLPRYQTGAGVRLMLVVQAPMVTTTVCTVTYTNQDGTSGRVSTAALIAGLNIGVCATTAGQTGAVTEVTPFFPLASGDTGMRSIQSVQFSNGAGGFVCLALVKPLANMMVYESGFPCEKQFGFDMMSFPEVLPGAYLNFAIHRSGTLAGSLRSELLFVNS